ncbi:hypothetical protein C8Q76DRAFT_810089 [Earliella scabrosa]|nr:hypothetical protein C8Q76DRAFT_810089 [Earliella scabrosa]
MMLPFLYINPPYRRCRRLRQVAHQALGPAHAIAGLGTRTFTQSLFNVRFHDTLKAAYICVGDSCFVSVNIFSFLCDGSDHVPTSALGSITCYGGPILYLIAYGLLVFGFLVFVDSGSPWKEQLLSLSPRTAKSRADVESEKADVQRPDVLAEEEAVRNSSDALRVLGVQDLQGRGHGRRLSRAPLARRVPAIDAQLTVREHLLVYARLKGLARGPEAQANVERVLAMTGLSAYADRFASKLSGGNQRKLALTIALIANPYVLLVDEFSSGVDAKMKWTTLKHVAVGHGLDGRGVDAREQGRHHREAHARPSWPASPRAHGQRRHEQLFGILALGRGIGKRTVEKASLESVFMKVVHNTVQEEDGERPKNPWGFWRR